MTMAPYEVRVLGALGGAGQDAFCDVTVSTQPALTLLAGTFDQAGLHAFLDRIRALGLELVDLKQTPAVAPSSAQPSAQPSEQSSASDEAPPK
jgi:hypothetical protein